MNEVAALTDGSMTPGIYRVLGLTEPVTETVEAVGWRAAVVSPSIRTRDFYSGLAQALALPPYFGRNLDAFWDCLTDLQGPTALILSDWTRFAQARPERWAALMEVFEARTAQGPPFSVILN